MFLENLEFIVVSIGQDEGSLKIVLSTWIKKKGRVTSLKLPTSVSVHNKELLAQSKPKDDWEDVSSYVIQSKHGKIHLNNRFLSF